MAVIVVSGSPDVILDLWCTSSIWGASRTWTLNLTKYDDHSWRTRCNIDKSGLANGWAWCIVYKSNWWWYWYACAPGIICSEHLSCEMIMNGRQIVPSKILMHKRTWSCLWHGQGCTCMYTLYRFMRWIKRNRFMSDSMFWYPKWATQFCLWDLISLNYMLDERISRQPYGH